MEMPSNYDKSSKFVNINSFWEFQMIKISPQFSQFRRVGITIPYKEKPPSDFHLKIQIRFTQKAIDRFYKKSLQLGSLPCVLEVTQPNQSN